MTRAMAAGALVCALLLTSGCGGDSSSSSEKTPSPSPSSASASTTPTPSAPALPEAATKNTKAGAIAFVRHYVRAYNFAQRSGDIESLHRLAAPGCGSCKKVEEQIERIYGSGGSFQGGAWSIGQVVAQKSSPGSWVVSVGGRIAKSIEHPGNGGDPIRSPGTSANVNFYVEYANGWRVQQWRRF